MKNLSRVYSAELEGVKAQLVEVEIDLHSGLHAFNIVGLADKALSEARERVSAAIKNIGARPPNQENRRIIVNLAPADLHKTGSQYDLAIAIGYLLSTKQIPEFDTKNKMFLGELALDGSLRPILGTLTITKLAKELGFEEIFVPEKNAAEAALVAGIKIYPVGDLKELTLHLENKNPLSPQPKTEVSSLVKIKKPEEEILLSDIKGQMMAKRALVIAAAGRHNILFAGTPGAGKSMLARALKSILPSLNLEEVIEVAEIYSAANMLSNGIETDRPFRSPHHSSSLPALIGGGSNPKPGEISLAHRGVLFLDELPEFKRDALEALRQPLEEKRVIVSRAKTNVQFPADFILVTAMNPCPCGFYGDNKKACVCTAHQVNQYQKKVSGPLLDRIDLQINVPRAEVSELYKKDDEVDREIKNKNVIDLISETAERQKNRFEKLGVSYKYNSEINSKDCKKIIKLDPEAERVMENLADNATVSARGFFKILKIAQTIADLEKKDLVDEGCVMEAFSYRFKS